MKKILHSGIVCFFLIQQADAQKVDSNFVIDSIKKEITNFFVHEGLLDKKKIGNNFNYFFAAEIEQKRSIGYDINGIYRIGVYQSHSTECILIKEGNEFKIFNLEEVEISQIIKVIIGFSDRHKIEPEKTLLYIREVIQIYDSNQIKPSERIKKSSTSPN